MHEKEKIYRARYAGLSLQPLIKDLSFPGHDSSAISQTFPSFFSLKLRTFISSPLPPDSKILQV